MNTLTWIIVIAVVVLLVLGAVVLARRWNDNRLQHRRERAAQLREQAQATHTGIKQKQAEADETAARAKAARSEAQRLEAQAADKRSTLSEHVQRRDELLEEADRLDPDGTDAAHKAV